MFSSGQKTSFPLIDLEKDAWNERLEPILYKGYLFGEYGNNILADRGRA